MLVMSLSRNFLASAKGLHFNFRAETKLTILTIYLSKNSNAVIYLMFNFMNLYKRIGIFGVENYNLIIFKLIPLK